MRTFSCFAALVLVLFLLGCDALQGLIDDRPPCPVLTAHPRTGTAPLHVAFDGAGSHGERPIVSYGWDFGDGTTSSAFGTADHAYSAPGVYDARLTVTDDRGAMGECSLTITVENTPPVANCRFSSDAPVVGERIVLDAVGSIDPDGTIIDVQWDLGDGTTRRGSRISHIYQAPNVYVLTLTVVDDCGGTDTVTHRMTVHTGGGGRRCGG